MTFKPLVANLYVASLLNLFLLAISALMWLLFHALHSSLAPTMLALSILLGASWLVTFVTIFYLDLSARLNADNKD